MIFQSSNFQCPTLDLSWRLSIPTYLRLYTGVYSFETDPRGSSVGPKFLQLLGCRKLILKFFNFLLKNPEKLLIACNWNSFPRLG